MEQFGRGFESDFDARRAVEKIKEGQMEMVDGHPICKDCLDGQHARHHLDNEELRKARRVDCKNEGVVIQEIDGEKKEVRKQCHCGMGGKVVRDEGGKPKWEYFPECNPKNFE